MSAQLGRIQEAPPIADIRYTTQTGTADLPEFTLPIQVQSPLYTTLHDIRNRGGQWPKLSLHREFHNRLDPVTGPAWGPTTFV